MAESPTALPSVAELAEELGLEHQVAARLLAWLKVRLPQDPLVPASPDRDPLGSAPHGTALQNTAHHGTALQNTALQNTALQNTALQNTTQQSTSSHTAGATTERTAADLPATAEPGGETFVFGPEDLPSGEHPIIDTSRPPATRYEDRGLLGRGGMGEVRRVFDRQLERSVAMKILTADPATGTSRFVEEARTIARLQHPGVLPVHEIGRDGDGRVYFTMQEIRGRTLRDHVKAVHEASGEDHWRTAPGGWTFRRLVDAYQVVCETVAYAHGEGLVHRDLKPRNIMVGEHGEVIVVDWGLARRKGAQGTPGSLVGTPAYLAPELLQDPPPPIHPRTDVYALGAILFNILTNRAPFEDEAPAAILDRVRAGPSPVPTSARPLPDELVELCIRSMTRDPNARVGHAGVVAAAVRTWLDGSQKRSQGLDLVERARLVLPEAHALRDQAAVLEERWGQALAGIPPWAPESDKHPAWAGLDRADALRARADARESEAELVLQGALTFDPTLAEAHAELAVRNRARHAEAERTGDDAAAAASLVRLQRHLDALPAHHGQRAELRRYLRGTGALTLHTDPPGARVVARRVVRRNRRAVLESGIELGLTPLDGAPLGHGSWVVELEHPDCEPVRYPVRIGRGEHWDGVPPGASVPHALYLPPQGSLASEECYVPAGWTWVGGDPVAFGSAVRRRLWIPGVVLGRTPITNSRYLAFLDDLVAQRRQDEALRYAPRERSGPQALDDEPVYGRHPDGRFFLRQDSHGDLWRPQEPVLHISWDAATAYARWRSDQDGRPWRLPSEWEWEKAARGVDERPYPWGRDFDPSRACTRLSHRRDPEPCDVGAYPVDQSVYGVRGLGGNVRDWCLDVFAELPPPEDSRFVPRPVDDPDAPRVNRGGFWLGNARDARSADRHFHPPSHRSAEIGVRIARSLPEDP